MNLNAEPVFLRQRCLPSQSHCREVGNQKCLWSLWGVFHSRAQGHMEVGEGKGPPSWHCQLQWGLKGHQGHEWLQGLGTQMGLEWEGWHWARPHAELAGTGSHRGNESTDLPHFLPGPVFQGGLASPSPLRCRPSLSHALPGPLT